MFESWVGIIRKARKMNGGQTNRSLPLNHSLRPLIFSWERRKTKTEKFSSCNLSAAEWVFQSKTDTFMMNADSNNDLFSFLTHSYTSVLHTDVFHPVFRPFGRVRKWMFQQKLLHTVKISYNYITRAGFKCAPITQRMSGCFHSTMGSLLGEVGFTWR